MMGVCAKTRQDNRSELIASEHDMPPALIAVLEYLIKVRNRPEGFDVSWGTGALD